MFASSCNKWGPLSVSQLIKVEQLAKKYLHTEKWLSYTSVYRQIDNNVLHPVYCHYRIILTASVSIFFTKYRRKTIPLFRFALVLQNNIPDSRWHFPTHGLVFTYSTFTEDLNIFYKQLNPSNINPLLCRQTSNIYTQSVLMKMVWELKHFLNTWKRTHLRWSELEVTTSALTLF